MLAMTLDDGARRLKPTHLPDPQPGPGEVVIRVSACGVCRTDLHVVDGDLAPRDSEPSARIIPTRKLALE